MDLYHLRFVFIMLILDFAYISTIGNSLFSKTIRNIQNSNMKISYLGAFISYILLIIALYYFIISKNASIMDAFVLGVVIYGVFDFTNIALFSNYDIYTGIIDTLWGGILFSLTTFLYKISEK